MPLSKEQLDQIKRFIHSRGFDTIEVEMEILDHVASAIEERLEKEPDTNIEEAIRTVHSSFGVLGFSVFEDNLQANLGKQISRTFRRQIWLHWSTSKFARILLTAPLIFTLLIVLSNSMSPGLFQVTAFFSIAAIGSIPALYHQRIFKKWGRKSLVLGRLLWPFVFGSFATAYFIQLFPVEFLSTDWSSFSLFIAGISLAVATSAWSAYSLIQEVYAWTEEKWLKYAN